MRTQMILIALTIDASCLPSAIVFQEKNVVTLHLLS